MTRIDFYVSKETAPGTRERLACRLAEKAFTLGHDVFIHTPNPERAQQLDELLWTYRDGAFVPHDVGHDKGAAAVTIGQGDEPVHTPHLLINLADDVPAFFSRFERVAEFVHDDEQIKANGRDRFRFYKERGYPLQSTDL